MRVEDFFFGIR